ncbi:MAG TPA: hypothetical protein VF188_07085 [Longimicrobiales bacterium]
MTQFLDSVVDWLFRNWPLLSLLGGGLLLWEWLVRMEPARAAVVRMAAVAAGVLGALAAHRAGYTPALIAYAVTATLIFIGVLRRSSNARLVGRAGWNVAGAAGFAIAYYLVHIGAVL